MGPDAPAHTIAVKRLEQSIRPIGSCFTYQDMYVRFPDGSYKRPDLAIYCTEVPATVEAATIHLEMGCSVTVSL